MECIAVDWSGALTGAAARIWLASASAGELLSLHAPGSRDAVHALLLARRADPRPVLVGLDFAFSLPAWFLRQRGWTSVQGLWQAAAADGEAWLRDCRPPFWGRPGAGRPHAVERGLRRTEREIDGPAPKSVFQVGGAGAVGTGSVRGMPMLLSLQVAGWAVWPFDAPGTHTLVEIYPRWLTGAVLKRRSDARAAYLHQHEPHVPPAFRKQMIASEDAFDAGISALVMSRQAHHAPVIVTADQDVPLEGWIWRPATTSNRAR
jgi:hypothetical protein